MESMGMKNTFWANKRVFLTGHTGFKGTWLLVWLNKLGAQVAGYALAPNTNPSMFELIKGEQLLVAHTLADIRDSSCLSNAIQQFKPEIIIHMAAQPLVRYSYQAPVETYQTNVMGTVNVLEAARVCESVKVILNVTTDKCYENKEWCWGYRENEPLGGYDPYSSSKACSELVTSAYRQSFFQEKGVAVATARAGNVIGGGDWAKDRLVPDILRALIKKQDLSLRFPNSTRPWQHVLQPLSGYLILIQKMFHNLQDYNEAWNFGPDKSCEVSVRYLAEKLIKEWGDVDLKSNVLFEKNHFHEANYLRLVTDKAETQLKWRPHWSLEKSLAAITDWYKSWRANGDLWAITLEQIADYERCLSGS